MKEIDLRDAPSKIKDGALIIAPLSSGYALICDARNEETVSILREIKQRPAAKGFTILIDSDARLNRYVKEVPALAWDIIDTAENDLTIILPEGNKSVGTALASDNSIAIRMVKEKDEIRLVQAANGPIASTALLSENGNIVESIDEASKDVLSKVDYIISLPTQIFNIPEKKTPIVSLGLNGEVQVVRE